MRLKNYLQKISYLRHPYIISRAILRPIEVWESKRHQLRLREYNRYSVSPEDGVQSLTGYRKSEVVKLMKELDDSAFLQHIDLSIKKTEGIGGSISIELGLLLYVLARALKPEVVVETGVANGISSSFILKALDENARGRLCSVDLHCREGVAVPLGKELGGNPRRAKAEVEFEFG